MTKQNSEIKTKQTSPDLGSFFSQKYSKARLVFADGEVFEGFAFGAVLKLVVGEVVFHTGMSGYQEIMTDPSYYGQIATFTYPHIGSYGVNKGDQESKKVHARGMIIRDLVEDYSNYRADQSLSSWLESQGVMGLHGLDTRKLTRYIRSKGAVAAAFGTDDVKTLRAAAKRAKPTDDLDLVKEVTTKKNYKLGKGKRTIVAYDFGIKRSILDNLEKLGKVIVVPASASAKEVMSLKPSGVFLSNGPGDPSAVGYASDEIAKLIGKVPIFGICLGHQLLCRAVGGSTHKLDFGHHGANHPVKDLTTSKVEITSQNHNYAVDAKSLQGADVSHVNLNDEVVEGIELKDKKAFSVQYHPEAGPGPHDSLYLFDRFKELMDDYAKKK